MDVVPVCDLPLPWPIPKKRYQQIGTTTNAIRKTMKTRRSPLNAECHGFFLCSYPMPHETLVWIPLPFPWSVIHGLLVSQAQRTQIWKAPCAKPGSSGLRAT